MDRITQSERIKKALTKIVRNILKNDSDFQSCFRVYLAKVTVAPDAVSKKCSVRLISQQTELTIPFSSACSGCSVGDMVLVGTVSNSFRNAVVWQKYDFS